MKAALTAKVELYERGSMGLERVTTMGRKNRARHWWHSKIKLSPTQRYAGILYGHSVELVACGGRTSGFMREYVDGGFTGSGGPSAQFERASMLVKAAKLCLRRRRLIRHNPNHAKDRTRVGAHRPIRPYDLLNLVMVEGMTIDDIGRAYRWTRVVKGKPVVPRAQETRITDGLRDTLDMLIDGWTDAGFRLEVSNVET